MSKIAIFIIAMLIFVGLSPGVQAQYAELIGQEVLLQSFVEDGAVYVGTDKNNFNAGIGNLMGNDPETYLMLILSHRGFEVSSLTKARILDISFYEQAVEVQILDGPYKGRTGWVLFEQATGY